MRMVRTENKPLMIAETDTHIYRLVEVVTGGGGWVLECREIVKHEWGTVRHWRPAAGLHTVRTYVLGYFDALDARI